MENMPDQNCCASADFKNPRFILKVLGIIVLGAIVIVSIVRDRIVNPNQNQVTVVGRGKVEAKPDTATVTLGVQVDKAPTAQNALEQLNAKMTQIVAAETALGIPQDKIQTQNYSLSPQYDYSNGKSTVSGYTANQQLSVKVEGLGNSTELLGQAISAANQAGANQVLGVKFESASVDALKQQARLLAIQDAKAKSKGMADAAGVRLGKITSWYENVLASPDFQDYPQATGMGAGGDLASAKAVTPPQVPSGTQEVVIEMNVSYEVK